MKNFWIILLVIILALLLVWVTLVPPSSKGIVGLDGWEHGVALCDGGEDTPRELVKVAGDNYGYHWTKDGIYYMINREAIEDTDKINKLREQANKECAQYLD